MARVAQTRFVRCTARGVVVARTSRQQARSKGMSKYGPAISATQEALDLTSRCYDHLKGKAKGLPDDEESQKEAMALELAATSCYECVSELRSTLAGLEAGTHDGLHVGAERCHATAQALDLHELDPSAFTAAEACRRAEKALRAVQ